MKLVVLREGKEVPITFTPRTVVFYPTQIYETISMLLLTLLPLLRMWMLLIITMKRALPQRLTAHRALVTAGARSRHRSVGSFGGYSKTSRASPEPLQAA